MNDDKKIEVRDLKNGNWYWIPKAVIQHAPKIRTTGIAVYNFLASLVNRNQSCFPSQKYIADLTLTVKVKSKFGMIKTIRLLGFMSTMMFLQKRGGLAAHMIGV